MGPYLVGVGAVLVLGAVRGVGEGFVAALVLAHVGFLTRVRAQVGLEVLQAGISLVTALKLQQSGVGRVTHVTRLWRMSPLIPHHGHTMDLTCPAQVQPLTVAQPLTLGPWQPLRDTPNWDGQQPPAPHPD